MANATTRVDLVINRLSQQKYDQLSAAGLLNPNQLYVTSGGADAVLETREVAGKALSADVTAADISSAIGLGGYSLTGHTHSNYVPTSRTVAGKALTANVSASDISTAIGLGGYSLTSHNHDSAYAAKTHTHSDYVLTSRTVAGKALTANIAASDISTAIGLGGYVPKTRKVAGQQLTADVTPATISSAIGLGSYSLTSHVHSQYLTAVPSAYKTYSDTKQSLSGDGYATQAQLDAKSAVSVDGDHTDVNMVHISLDDYSEKLIGGEILSNQLYVVSSDYVETYGQQIKNVADPTDLSDAATKGYVDGNFQPAGDYLTAVPSDYRTYAATLSSLSSTYSLTSHVHGQYSLTSHTHSNYVPASRTVAGMQLTGNVTLKSLSFGSKNYNGSTALTVTAGDLGALTAHQSLTGYVPTSRKVAGQQLTGDVTPATISTAIGLGGYVPTSRTVAGKALTANVAASDISTAIGLGSYSLTSHTHSQYALTSHNHDSAYAAKTHTHSQYLTAHQPISAVYVNQHIRLSANNALVGNIDCSDFVKDGMLSAVELCSDQLIFIFNAESGKTAISVALSNFIDETNYYTKAELTGATGVLKGYSLTSHNHDSAYKPKQTAKTSPSASGSTTSFIDTITQDVNGVITATKKNVQTASTTQTGIVQLDNTLTSTSTTKAATANAVKLTNDKFSSYLPLSGGNMTGALSVHYGQYQGPTGAPYVKIDAYENQDYSGTANIQIVGDIDAQPYLEIVQKDDNGDNFQSIEIGPSWLYINGNDWGWPWLGSLSSQDEERTIANNADIRQYCAFKSELGYTLSTATGVLSSGSYVYKVADRTMTTIGINQSTTPVVVQLPAAGQGARDFILRIEISSSAAPTFTFTNTAGLDFESEDDDWAVMQPGVNLISFTETKR